jgi:hypothetical protein
LSSSNVADAFLFMAALDLGKGVFSSFFDSERSFFVVCGPLGQKRFVLALAN